MRRFVFVILLFSLCITPLAQASDFEMLLKSGENYLYSWRVSQASKVADKALEVARSADDKAHAYYLKSRVEFYKGNYKEAKEFGKEAHMLLSTDKEIGSFLDHILKVAEIGEKFKEVKTEHFMIRYSHPKDSILAEYAEDVLEKVYYEIGLDLGTYPREPVIVEIYPDLQSFTLASTLSLKDIKITGVVGICKFNRIMIVSPRLLPQGYTWFDTLAHEYTHYLTFLRSENTVPVWLHEGIAKFHEKRWKEKKRNVINPFYETLLARAIKENSLVPIEKMHPSLGKLSSAHEAQLAFAQVGTIVDFLVKKWGSDALLNLLDTMREKKDYKVAVKEVTKTDFSRFYSAWIKDLKSRNLKERIPQVKVRELRFDGNKEKSKDRSEDLLELEDTRSRNYTRLGDMLRARGRLRAATYEYEKALHFDPISPVILNRLASTQITSGEYDKAEEKLMPLLEFYPEYIDTYINLGRIYLEKGNLKKAEVAYREAISINPFNPEIHIALISIYQKLGLPDLEEKEKKVLSILIKEDANIKPQTNTNE
jgi:tetratricopeptide (TPR) repeat protein